MTTALSLRGVHKHFRAGRPDCLRTINALRDIHADVHVGEVVGLVGPRRAGKTTLLHCAAGMIGIDSGVVRWFGVGDGGLPGPAAAHGVALVPEYVSYYSFLAVREAIDYYATLRDLPLASRAESLVVALRRVGLEARSRSRIASLSAGALRRLALAQALLVRPRVLLVDAPRDPIDEIGRSHVAAILRELAGEGVAVLVAARDESELTGCASRIIRIHDGSIVEARPTRSADPNAVRRTTEPRRPARVAEPV